MKIVAVVTLAVLSIQATHCEEFKVKVDLDKVVNTIGEEYVSVKFSADIFKDFSKKMDTSSKVLQSLAKALKPSVLRIGGSAAQFLIFKANDDREKSGKDRKNFTFTGKDWKSMCNFADKVGWKMMFNFNQFLRKGDKWDDANAEEFLKYSDENKISIPYFQLGSEPNSYDFNYGFTYDGARLAKDLKILRKLLSDFPKYKHSKIIGPDVTRMFRSSGLDYLREFLAHGGSKLVSAVGWHHYYLSSHHATLRDMTNATILNWLACQLRDVKKIVEPYNLPVWLTAASSLTSGGLKGGSNRYVAGFMWLDKLGLCALYGVKTVIRQTFLGGGSYSLIADDFFPYPDYFLSVLYKRLVKGPVFNVTTSKKEVRAYASCTNTDGQYEKGALTVYILNLKDHSVTVNFPDYAGQTYDFYLLEPGDGKGLTSKYVKLNKNKLVMKGAKLPELLPVKTSHIKFPKKTFGFIVIPNAHVKAC